MCQASCPELVQLLHLISALGRKTGFDSVKTYCLESSSRNDFLFCNVIGAGRIIKVQAIFPSYSCFHSPNILIHIMSLSALDILAENEYALQ